MKIISWNVNGLRAAWNHGLATFMDSCEADIYAFQETRVDAPFRPIELEGYYTYWSFNKTQKGYSGTVCLTNHAPLHVWRELRDKEFDTEGRLIVLEFERFFLINCYIPNSQRSLDRAEYRRKWDALFLENLEKLQEKKPVIICGDFNTTISETDVYEENQRKERDDEAFLTTERENMLAILNKGFVDSYRYVHPDEVGKYTWWSNRLYKRKENKGWRLDYFLINEALKDKITESTMLMDVRGSDHCPILLDIDLYFYGDLQRPNPTDKLEESTYQIARRTSRESLGKLWDTVDWEQAEKTLADMQRWLTKAAYGHHAKHMLEWQKQIVHSPEARLLAVRHVCDTASGPGVDGIKWTQSYEKMLASLSLTTAKYKALPSRLLILTSKHGKQRHIHIDTYFDRAMQCLFAYTLDPIAEAWGDRKSFAYRKGRSAFDLNEYIKRGLSGERAPEWIFIGDVRKCYEHISHEWILQHIPMAPYMLKEFLKAGYVFGGELFPADEGVSIGASLSPIIANMTLDGLSDYVYSRLHKHDETDYLDGNMVRYADDILFMARTEESARKIRTYVTEFLEERGLMLSHEKSMIIHVEKGFSFMSRTYYKKGTQLLARPSDKSIERFMENVRDTIKNYTGSQQSLIEKLNRKIDGWCTYHKTDESEEAFRKMDVYINALLLELCESKHPKWSREKILQKYWYTDAEGRYCYALPNKKEVRVKFLADTLLVNYNAVSTTVNPYLDTEYLNKRSGERGMLNVSSVYRAIWNRQKGKCFYCGHEILRDEEKELIEAFPEKRRFTSRMAYVHHRCLSGTLDYIDTEVHPASLGDLRELLQQLETGRMPKSQKFHKLYKFFQTCHESSVSLTFKEIEKIMGEPLPPGAWNRIFWQRTGFLCISQCWLENGYVIKKLLPTKEKIVFCMKEKAMNAAKVDIPDVLLHGMIPLDAKNELENYFQYIMKKYGI